jgi:hypothetical protein
VKDLRWAYGLVGVGREELVFARLRDRVYSANVSLKEEFVLHRGEIPQNLTFWWGEPDAVLLRPNQAVDYVLECEGNGG